MAASVADQGVASGTNFVLNLLLARWLSQREYGAYSVAWSILLISSGFHNALILEPMTVLGTAQFSNEIDGYARGVQKFNWLAIAVLAVVLLPVAMLYRSGMAREAIFVVAACLPGYLIFLVGRRWQYVMDRPIRAFFLSVVYAELLGSEVAVLRFRGNLTAVTALLSIGWAGFAGLGMGRNGKATAMKVGTILQRHWAYGKWLLASAMFTIGASDLQTVLLSLMVDLKSAGALRALMNFVLPLSQLVVVLNVYALPRLSSQGRLNDFRFPGVIAATAGLYAIVLVLFAAQLDQLLYAGKMHQYLSSIPLLALSAWIAAVGSSFSTLLRAVQNSQHQFFSGVMGTAVGFGSAFYLMPRIGFVGAFWSLLASNLTSALITLGWYIRFRQLRNA